MFFKLEKKSITLDVLKIPKNDNCKTENDVINLNRKSNGYILLDFTNKGDNLKVYYCRGSLDNRLNLTDSFLGNYYFGSKRDDLIPDSIEIISSEVIQEIAKFNCFQNKEKKLPSSISIFKNTYKTEIDNKNTNNNLLDTIDKAIHFVNTFHLN